MLEQRIQQHFFDSADLKYQAAEALTGPIARGDVETVDVHLRALDSALPERAKLYRAMGFATVEMIEGKKLGRDVAAELKYRLRGGYYGQ